MEQGFAQKVLILGFLCATSVSSVSLWCGFTRNSSTTETQRTQRLHREERDRDFLCKAMEQALFAIDNQHGAESLNAARMSFANLKRTLFEDAKYSMLKGSKMSDR
jgi:hypothetical protein